MLGGAPAIAAGCSQALPQKLNRTIEPYTANQKTTTVQTLANGTTITRETTARIARDSSGRTFRETVMDYRTGDGQIPKQSMFNVMDPVNRLNINWSSNSKVANVFHMPDPAQVRRTPPPLSPAPAPSANVQTAVIPRPRMPEAHTESLGTKTIDGLEATGTRTTQTFAVGEIGNDQPIIVTHETWMSIDLRISVLQIDDDPRTGVRTTQLIDIERGEPDPALFDPPEGYTIKDQYPNPPNAPLAGVE
jgi:hypothetical protein